jgi:hypothetical protein
MPHCSKALFPVENILALFAIAFPFDIPEGASASCRLTYLSTELCGVPPKKSPQVSSEFSAGENFESCKRMATQQNQQQEALGVVRFKSSHPDKNFRGASIETDAPLIFIVPARKRLGRLRRVVARRPDDSKLVIA